MADEKEFQDPLKPFSEAYANYQAALLETFSPPDLQQRVRDVQNGFISSSADPQRQFEVYRQLIETVSELRDPQRLSGGSERAYREFVSSLQKAFANVDPESITPAHLAAIARGIAHAAWTAAYTPSS